MSKRNLDDTTFRALLLQASTSAGTTWILFTDVAIAAFGHANEHNHSPDRVRTAYDELLKCDVGTIDAAFKRAAHVCCALKLSKDKDGKATSTFDKEQWEKIKTSDLDPMAALESKENGLKSYKPVKKKGSDKNRITAHNLYQADYTNKIGELMDDIIKEDKENPLVLELQGKLTTLIAELENELGKIQAKKLTETMKPTGPTNVEGPEQEQLVASL